ncbi:MAG: RDD family protein [Rhodoluna sp.]
MDELDNWAGKRLGLPASGPGSLAKFGRRVLALFIDWAASTLIALGLFGGNFYHPDFNTAQVLIFAVEQWILVATLGFSFGHRLVGLRVKKLDGSYVGFWASLLRIGLILLVIPATIWDADNRGLHDKAAKTVLVIR